MGTLGKEYLEGLKKALLESLANVEAELAKAQQPPKKLVRIHAIIDASGSMENLRDDTIRGFNSFVDEQRANTDTDVEVSLTLFGGSYTVNRYITTTIAGASISPQTGVRVLYSNRPIADMKPLTREEYQPSGNTPLLDAVGRTLLAATLAGEPEGREVANIVLVITDGAENASREYTRDGVRNLMKAFEKSGAWSFAYIGSDASTWVDAQSLNVAGGNTIVYTPDSAGITYTYNLMSRAVGAYRSNYSSGLGTATVSNLADLGAQTSAPPVPTDLTTKTEA